MSRAAEFQPRNRNPGCGRVGSRDREQSSLGGIHDAGIAVETVWNGRKIVAQTVVQRELRRRLPVVKDEEAVTPLRHRTFDAGGRRYVGKWTSKRKVCASVAGDIAVESKLSER